MQIRSMDLPSMVMGAAASTALYNLKLRHPTLDMLLIHYDLALLMQPKLMLRISIGVVFNVIFADWMLTVLLIILFIGTCACCIPLLVVVSPCINVIRSMSNRKPKDGTTSGMDTMSVARNILKHPKLVLDGGVTELTVSATLKQKSSSIEGIEKHANGENAWTGIDAIWVQLQI